MSKRRLIDVSQRTHRVSAQSFNVFGRSRESSEEFPGAITFAGGLTVDETELICFDSRLYMPSIYRFTSRDRKFDGLWGINPYVYALNKPLVFVDPTGLSPTLPSSELSTYAIGGLLSGGGGYGGEASGGVYFVVDKENFEVHEVGVYGSVAHGAEGGVGASLSAEITVFEGRGSDVLDGGYTTIGGSGKVGILGTGVSVGADIVVDRTGSIVGGSGSFGGSIGFTPIEQHGRIGTGRRLPLYNRN